MSTTLNTYKEWKRQLEENKATAEQRAAEDRNEAVVRADGDLARSKSTYGQLAEQLGQAGLAGTGYSDNLQRDAYAARQQSVAAADRTYASTMRDIESDYQANVFSANVKEQEAETERNKAYNDFYYYTQTGDAIELIKSTAVANGFTLPQLNALLEKAGWSSIDEAEYDRMMGNTSEETAGGGTNSAIGGTDSAIGTETPGGSTEGSTNGAQGSGAVTDTLSENAKSVISAIHSTAVGDSSQLAESFAAWTAAYDSNAFSALERAEIGKALNKLVRTNDSYGLSYLSRAVNAAGTREGASALKAAWKWADADTVRAIDASAEQQYASGGSYIDAGSLKDFKAYTDEKYPTDDTIKEGDKFKIKIGGTSYAVESGERVTDDAINNAASKLSSGQVFFYGGKLYFKHSNDADNRYGGDVYEVSSERQPREYSALMAAAAAGNGDIKSAVMDGYHVKLAKGDVKEGSHVDLVDTYGTNYKVQIDGKTTVKAPSGVGDGEVFRAGDTLYLYHGGEVYTLERRNMFYQKSYRYLQGQLDLFTKNAEERVEKPAASTQTTAPSSPPQTAPSRTTEESTEKGPGIMDEVKGTVNDATDAVKKTGQDLLDKGGQAVDAVKETGQDLVGKAGQAVDSVKETGGNFINRVKQFFATDGESEEDDPGFFEKAKRFFEELFGGGE